MSCAPCARSPARGRGIDEESLIAALRAIVEPDGPRGPLRIGIGDDGAVWQPSRSHLSVITTDALVDGVHFRSEEMGAEAIGVRAMAANLSDAAAMGARPVLATVALGVAASTSQAWILECYRGMATLAGKYHTHIAGGDVVRAPATFLSITIVAQVSRSHLKRRDGGRAGDVLAVTGPLGASRAGLEVLRGTSAADAEARAAATRAFERPEPRVLEGRWLGASSHVHAMIDCSDGFSIDADRLARASGCGATLENVPVATAAAAIARGAGEDSLRYALEGGEDFELVVAIAPRAFAHLARRFEGRFKRPLLRAGTLEREAGLRMRRSDGTVRALTPSGWDHLKAGD